MEVGNWNEIEVKLKTKIEEIFKGFDLNKLSNYEKRKAIFDYLCRTLNYDYPLLNEIREQALRIKNNVANEYPRLVRNPYKELESVMDKNIGICNAISQYYKLLLEQVGINAYCVICDDGTEVNHQLNIVYDEDKKTYSFDDITSEIVGRGSINTFFDYDLEKAYSLNQGNRAIIDDQKWVILEDDYINYLVGRDSSPFPIIRELPSNINSVKNNRMIV